ncbi:MAG TPA: ribbon-helix-helix protein, CopG family [Campylobacteraceae bacterium]|jgi:predicted transcriptional regulator|nr:ribbon-helix-helix protein, CopG family [Campylobacteraceae bacterium]
MKTVTLKTDDAFFERLSRLAKEQQLTKSELIRRAVAEYERMVFRQKLKEQFRNASMKVREESRKVTEEFEDTLGDGLDAL